MLWPRRTKVDGWEPTDLKESAALTAIPGHVFVAATEVLIQAPTSSSIPKQENERPRILALDGMRGVAAICVAVYHYQFLFCKGFHFFDWAWINVDLFFLISGIVMTHVYEKRIETGQTTFPEFLSHRIARLWPVHLIALFSMLILASMHHYLKWGEIVDWSAPLYTFLLNLVFLQNIGLYNGQYQGHTWDGNGWSLTPEIIANLVWFYFLSRKKLSSKLLISVVLVCAILQYNLADSFNGLILDSNLVRCAISYGIGCLLYRHIIANSALTAPPRPWGDLAGLGLAILIVLIIVNLAWWHSPIFNKWEWILVLFVFPAITCFALQHDTVLSRILSSKVFVFLGSISYSVYLLHVLVGYLIIDTCTYLFKLEIQAPYAGVIYLFLTIEIATLTYLFIETPARRVLRAKLGPFLQKIFFEAN